MKKKILIMGLPGSGKTFLAQSLLKYFKAKWLNNDEIRKKYNDWDFSLEGRQRQSQRMRELSDEFIKNDNNVVADFVCPTDLTRKDYDADYIIWVDTLKEGKYEDTNKLFVPPSKFNFKVTSQDSESWSKKIFEDLKLNGLEL
tara:strand:- start:1100 stop:1528 length:429 start_codon:yes stop_codon:yes gene_type:complete